MKMTCKHGAGLKSKTGMAVFILSLLFALIYIRPSFADGFMYKEEAIQMPVQFFAGNQDIPLMPGLVELEARSFSYDKPEGEITEMVARMDGVTAEQVLYYYEVTLPQFGWNRIIDAKGGSFYRKNEHLDFSFGTEDENNFVKIMIRPSL